VSHRAQAPLVGRDAEVGVLDRVLDDLWAGGSAALVVTGEPGIGKTRLLDELGLRATDRGAVVVSGRAAEYEADLPLAVWIDALEPHLATTATPGLSERDAAALAEALPSLARDPGAAVPERHRVHAAMRSLLAALATDRPLVVVLDDLHWADPASVDLIAALLRRPPAAEVLLALSLRQHQAPERLDIALARSLREGRTAELVLAPLDLAATTALLGDVPDRTRDLLYLESGGNPFYLEHLARNIDGDTSLPRAGIDAELPGVPHAVAVALAEERGALGPGVRIVLDAAAIVGVDFEPDTVAAVADVDEGDALGALDELAAVGLVRPHPGTRRFTMRHPLVRRAIYDTTGAGWRIAAHGRAATALLESGAPPEAYAHHVAVSAHAGDEDAVAVLAGAASGVRARAPASAARWYEDALRLLPDGAPSRRRELLSSLAHAQAAAGRLEDADAVLESAIATLALTEVRERVGLTVTRARFEHLRGSLDVAHGRLEAALADLPDDSDAEELALVITLAVDAFHRRDVDAVRRWGGRAEELGRAGGRPAHAAAGLALCALVDALVGDVEAALRRCDDAARLFDDLPNDQLADCLEAAQFIGLAEMYVERYEQAAAHGRRGIAVARATGQVQRVSVLAISQGFATAMLGRLHEARELLDGAVESTRLLDSDFALAWVMMNAALVDLLAGNLTEGRAKATEVVDIIEGLDDTVVAANAKSLVGQLELDEGRPVAAIATLHAAGGGPELPLIGGFWKVWLLESLTIAHLATGEIDRAAASARLAGEVADGLGLPLTASVATRALARVALARGNAGEAVELALAAVAGATSTGAEVERARARRLAGEALAAAGLREEAIGELGRAADAFETCGAHRDADATREVLRRLGDVRRHSTRGQRDGSGLATLTRRELEIAELVWDRRTNRQIAETLFLSPKTIETHLRNIFAKVLVSSRVELAREVERARITA
jgi:ATP/maltotriose-dependent transcriptional regulator MalT